MVLTMVTLVKVKSMGRKTNRGNIWHLLFFIFLLRKIMKLNENPFGYKEVLCS